MAGPVGLRSGAVASRSRASKSERFIFVMASVASNPGSTPTLQRDGGARFGLDDI